MYLLLSDSTLYHILKVAYTLGWQEELMAAMKEFEQFFGFTPLGGTLARIDRLAVNTELANIRHQIAHGGGDGEKLRKLQDRLAVGERLAREQHLL